jgi:hypothetical protein
MWWAGFSMDGVNWTGEGGELQWSETFEGEVKRGLCANCTAASRRSTVTSRNSASTSWPWRTPVAKTFPVNQSS